MTLCLDNNIFKKMEFKGTGNAYDENQESRLQGFESRKTSNAKYQ